MRPLLPLALAVAVLPSCITSDLNLAPLPNVPPSIESTSTAENPLNRVINYSPTSVGDGGVMDFQPFDLEFVVRDPDIEQPLEFLVFVDGRSRGIVGGGDVLDEDTSDDPSLRTVTFRTTSPIVTTLSVAPRCHKIEIAVSERFRPGGAVPETDGDIGTAVWWVATSVTDGEMVDMGTCP